MRRNKSKSRKRRPYWRAAIILLLLGVGGLYACSTGGSDYPGAEVTDVARETIATDLTTGPMEVSYLISGNRDARRIIFVHGTPGSATAWKGYLSPARQDFLTISIDRPGFGKSRPKRHVVKLTDQADAIAPFLKPDANGQKPILVGHSLGGPIIAKVAARYPDRIDGIVIVAGSLDPGLEKIHPAQYVGNVWPFTWIIGSTLRNSNRELLALEPELETLASELDRITVPISIIHGTKDTLVPYDNVPFMQTAFAQNKQVETITLEGLNHFLVWNSQPVIWSAIERMHRGETALITPSNRS